MSDSNPSVLVVGAGAGLGAAAARRFGREGFSVGLVGRTPRVLSQLVRDLASDGIAAFDVIADVTDERALVDGIAGLRDRLGPFQVMLFSPRPSLDWIKPVVDTAPADLAAALGLSVVAAAAATAAVLPDMRERGSGTLLFTTGGAAVEPHAGRAVSGIAYAAESMYVRMLHDSVAVDGVHAAQVTVVGALGPGEHHEPDAVAEELWRRHVRRDRPLVVLR